MQNRNWAAIHEFENLYEINELGEVRSLHQKNFQRLISSRIDRGGYYTVRLSKNGKTYTRLVHRLLATAFIPNPNGKNNVNHKNGNKQDNSLLNLEWCSLKENSQHAYKTGLSKVPEKNCKKVIDLCTNRVYNSVSEAAKALDLKYSTCKNYLNANRFNPTCLRYAV